MSRKYALIIPVLLVLIVTGIWVFKNLGIWLAKEDTPVPADLIICLSGEHRIAKAAQLHRQGLAETVLLTVNVTNDALVQKGVPPNSIKLAPGVRTTFEEALAAQQYVSQNPAATALVISDPYHLSRVRWSFKKAFKGMDIQLVFVGSDLFWPHRNWYNDALARYLVASEISKMVFYRTYHGLLGKETVPDWVWTWKNAYLRFLRKILYP